MAKKKSKPKTPQVKKEVKEQKKFTLPEHTQSYLLLGAIALLLLILLKPLVLDHLSPQGVDVIGSIGKTHQISQYSKDTGEKVLWNPNIFAGMPIYHRIHPQAWSLDNLLNRLGGWFSAVFIYYLFGVLGFFLLMRYLGMSPLLSAIGSLLFILMPHYKALFLVGHMAKFEALMYLPWIFLAFIYFLDKRSLTATALFALAFGLQIRTQHYQIVFYTALMVFALGVYPLIKDVLDKQYARFAKSTGLIIVALALALGMAAQPLFLAKEYLPYSKRGKTTVDIDRAAKKQNGSNGVSMQYATRWSTHPSEMLTWLVPHFYGGMSVETYEGSKYPRLKGRQVHTYWGYMPFTQSFEYMGVITLILALLGLWAFRKDKRIFSLALFALWLIVLSWGRHLEWFYALFYDYVPFFNKFRAPMMSVTVTYFVFSVFAVYGLKYLSSLKKTKDWLKEYKQLLYVLGGFFALGVVLFLYGQGASFVKAGGEQYQGQALEIIKNIRAELFTKDVMRYIVLVLINGGIIIGYVKGKINFTVLTVALAVLAVADLLNVQSHESKKYSDVKRIERRYFRQTSTDTFLKSDSEIFRIFPAGKLFGDNRWAYYHQTIGGYTPIKMYTIEELVEKNIYKGPDPKLPINWNVLKILDVKYVILEGAVQNEHLQLAHSDPAAGQYAYLFKDHLPRAFFVGRTRVIKDEIQRLKTINSPSFDPAEEAIVEEPLSAAVAKPDSAFTRVLKFTPNEEELEVFSDKQALLVISEVYYPPGWKIFVDGRQVKKIYRTDHAIQSIVVPAGQHKVLLKFEPDSYYRDIRIAYASLGVIYIALLFALIGYIVRNKRSRAVS